MRLFKIETVGTYDSSEKTFIVIGSDKTNALINLNNLSTYSQFHDDVINVVEYSGKGIRIS